MFCYKIFENGSDKLLAVCDADIIGKNFESGDVSISIDPEFYKEKECNETAIVKIAKNSTIINAVGNEIVGLLIDKKFVDKSSVISIGKVKHAQVVSIV